MKVFLTGSKGFIGSHIAEDLEQSNYQTTRFDLENNPFEDITDYKAVYQRMEGCNRVSHQAVWISNRKTEFGFKNPFQENLVNVGGTINVLKSAYERKCSNVVLASSLAANNVKWGTYGTSKRCIELYADSFRQLRGLKIACLRYAIVYGEGEWYSRILPKFIKLALNDEPLIIFGNGKQKRDWVHVNDVVNAHRIALNKELSGVYEVGSGNPATIEDLSHIIIDVLDSKSGIIYKKQINPSSPKSHSADENKFIPNWKPKITLKKGIERAAKWWKSYWEKTE